jgi:CubicO group peptidase (beta-lactamase class C family)
MKRTLLLLLIFGSALQLKSQVIATDSFEQVCTQGNISGAQLCTFSNAEISSPMSFGLRNVATNEEVTNTTIFEAASLSKPVFASLVYRLAEEDILDLDRPLAEYLPFEMISDKRMKEVTARHILTHSSGLPNWIKKTKKIKLKFDPGTDFNYSGEGFMYLQRVVEHITQQSLEELMVTYVFEPYGMDNSSFLFNDTLVDHAKPHDKKGLTQAKKLTQNFTSAASSLHTTAADYSKFLMHFVKDSMIFETMVEVDSKKGLYWGLGVGLEINESDTLIWHWGNNWNTFRSIFVYSTKEGRGYALLTNSENGHSVLQALNLLLHSESLQFPKWLGYQQIDVDVNN